MTAPHWDRPTLLMCPTEHFGIEYEINAWMDRNRPAHPHRAREQWEALHTVLQAAGAEILLLDPVPGLPDLVFTANAGLVHGPRFFVSRFRHEVRQREAPYFAAWFAAHAYEVCSLPDDRAFEGAGDALFCGDTLFAGYRFRSDARGHQQLGALLNCRVIPLELVDPRFYHLDTCFCPLSPQEALYYPPAFDEYGRRALEALIPRLVPVVEAEAVRFACNAVVVGRTVITNTGCPRLASDLDDLGYTPRETPLDEFVKAGGSAKCLTLRLDGEDAAAWRARSAPLRCSCP